MQKRILKSAVSVLALSAASITLIPMAVSFAETITYDGTASDAINLLQKEFFQSNDPNITWYSLYPGNFNTPGVTGNVINVTNSTNLPLLYDIDKRLPNVDYYNAPHRVYGGFTDIAGVVVADNKVFVTGGLVSNDVYGGFGLGAVSGNSVTLSGGAALGSIYGGFGLGAVSGNSVTVSGGTAADSIYGGFGNDVVTGNSVTLSGGAVRGSIYGGWSDHTVNSSNNTVTITGGEVNGAIYGAFAASDGKANVSGNKVTVSGPSTEAMFIMGAEAMGEGELAVSGNSVEISNKATTGRVFGGGNMSNGIVTGNSVTISAGATAETIYGGSTYGSGNVSGNSVSVNNASVSDEIYGGHSDDVGAVSDNHVNVVEGSNVNRVIGGFSENSGMVASNSVTLANSSSLAQVLGGWSSKGDANKNSVSITNGIVETDVVGGYITDIGSASDNKVVISGTSQVKAMAFGAYISSGTGTATRNSVEISGGIVGSEVESDVVSEIHGGRAADGDSVSNSVFMTGGLSKGSIYGGSSDGGKAIENVVSIQNAAVQGQINGGVGSNLAAKNSVSVASSVISDLVMGGRTFVETGLAEKNSVIISDGTIAAETISGGFSKLGKVSENTVNISDSIIEQSVFGGRVDDGTLNNSYAKNNNVEIVNSAIGGRVSAGEITGSDNTLIGSGDVIGNKLTVTGSSVARAAVGGWADAGLVQLNEVAISNSILKKSAIGGYVDKGVGNVEQNSLTLSNKTTVAEMAIGGYTASGNAIGNSVSITDTTVGENVYGGWSANGDAVNNIITLNGTDVKITGSVYGGYSANQLDQFTGNTLNLNGYRGSVAGIYNVQNYNWLLPKDVVNGDVLVQVTGDAVDLKNTIHSVAIENDGNRLNAHDQIVMIDKAMGTPLTTPKEVQQGQFIIYDVTMGVDANNKFVLNIADKKDETPATGGGETGGGNTGGETGGGNTGGETGGGNTGGETGGGNTGGETGGGNTGGEIGGGNTGGSNTGTIIEEAKRPNGTPAGRINPRTKAYSEGRVGALAFVNQAGDVIATSGIQSALAAIDAQGDSAKRFTVAPFMILSGSSQRYNTGSHVDIDGFNMAIGLAGATQVEAGHKIMFGAFYEYGHGTYKTYNGFDNLASVRGDGDTEYNGGGVFGRIEFAGTGLGRVTNLATTQTDGLYLDASLRGGKTKLEFDSNDLYDGEGYRGHYNSKASYVGAHGTLGYVFNFDEKQALDLYSRYLWTRVNGDNVVIGRDTLHFDRNTSSRIQLGGRYNYSYSQQFIPYVGLAYEHEFKASVSANAYGLALGEPSLKGDSGIVEAGFTVRPIANAPDLSVNIGGQGFFGRREGGAGSLKVKYQF